MEETITEKLERLERNIRRATFSPYIKKKMVFRFHELFEEEMKDTPTGKKWRKKLYS